MEQILPLRPSEGTNAANILTSDFQLPDLCDKKMSVVETTQFLVVNNSNPSKLIWWLYSKDLIKNTKTTQLYFTERIF